jgi:hypothetical protein
MHAAATVLLELEPAAHRLSMRINGLQCQLAARLSASCLRMLSVSCCCHEVTYHHQAMMMVDKLQQGFQHAQIHCFSRTPV